MDVIFDAAKDVLNQRKHKISLAAAVDMDMPAALFILDESQDYGESRMIAIGFIEVVLYVLVFVEIAEHPTLSALFRCAKPSQAKREFMPKTTKDGECPTLTREDFANAKRFDELPLSLQERLRARPKRGPQKAPTKVQIAIRLSPDVLEGLRATGDGWQTRVDEVMRAWLKRKPSVKR